MLRIRDKSGNVVPVSAGVAVEFLDENGRLGAVIIQKHDGLVEILTPGDQVFNAYANINKLRPAKVHKHEPFAGKPVTL